MAYLALKPCNFGGKAYAVGTAISDEAIDKRMAKKLTVAGKIQQVQMEISAQKNADEETTAGEIPNDAGEGDTSLISEITTEAQQKTVENNNGSNDTISPPVKTASKEPIPQKTEPAKKATSKNKEKQDSHSTV